MTRRDNWPAGWHCTRNSDGHNESHACHMVRTPCALVLDYPVHDCPYCECM